MAVEWLLSTVFGFMTGVVGGALGIMSSAIGLVPGAGSLAGGILVGYAWINTFLPVAEVGAGVVFLLVLYGVLFGYRFIREIWSLVPIIGGGS